MLFTTTTLYQYSERLFKFKAQVTDSINQIINVELNSNQNNNRKEQERQEEAANEFMMRLLSNNRMVMLRIAQAPNEHAFVRAYESPSMSKATPQEMLTLIDYALIQLYSSKGDQKSHQLKTLLKDKVFWTHYDSMTDMKIEKLMDKSVLAYYFQSVGKDKEALEKWKDIGKTREQRPVAVHETLSLLTRWFQPEDGQMRPYGEVQEMLKCFLSWVLDTE